MSDAAEEIDRLLHEYIGLSSGARFAEKIAFWDREAPDPLLAPEECVPMTRWSDLEAYWSKSSADVSEFHTALDRIDVVELAPGLALAVFEQRWRAGMRDGFFAGQPIGARVRVTMTFRRTEAGWRILSSVESHVDGITFFEDILGEAGVDPPAIPR